MASYCDDIVVGIQIASKIERYSVSDEGSAGDRSGLLNDIKDLRYTLERLKHALQRAQQRYQDRGPSFGVHVYEPLSDIVERERKAIVGDFVTTLTICDTLLEANKYTGRQCSSPRDVITRQLASQEQHLEATRGRVQLHSEKIRFALDLLAVGLLTGQPTGSKVVPLTSLAEIYPRCDGVERRFEDWACIEAPSDSEEILLSPGFDALLSHMHKSANGPDQFPEKYLEFLKSCWLLSRLKASTGYNTTPRGLYFRSAIASIEQALLARTQQSGDVVPYHDTTLLSLPNSAFRIWPRLQVPMDPAPAVAVNPAGNLSHTHPLSTRANEHLLANIKLASEGDMLADSVTIFQSSSERLRVVIKSVITSMPGQTSLIPLTVHSLEDRLIPRYCLPSIAEPTPEIAVYSRGEETLFKFSSFEDVYKFQTTLMGFDVSHDQSNIQCQFSDELFDLDCHGRIQLWQEPIILDGDTEDGDLIRSQSVLSRGSMAGRPHSRRNSLVPSSAATTTVCWTAGGWEAGAIRLPVVVIFTQLVDKRNRTRFATMFIELERGIYIDGTECNCCKDYDTCSKLVLVKEKSPGFSVRASYSDVDSNGQPDPNTFNLFPFRLPRHPGFGRMIPKQTKYLVLKFPSLPEKQQFHRELELRFRVRDKQITDQRDFTNGIRRRQERPEGRQSLMRSGRESLPPVSESPSLPSLPPVIDPLVAVPALDDAFARRSRSSSVRKSLRTDVAHPALPHRQSNPSNVHELRLSNATALSPAISARSPISAGTSVDSLNSPDKAIEELDSLIMNATDAIKTVQETPITPLWNDQTGYHEIKEYYGVSELPATTELGRTPSSLAPEAFIAHSRENLLYEAPDFNAIHPARRVQVHAAPQVYEQTLFSPYGPDALEHESGLRRVVAPIRAAAAPYSPDSINAGSRYQREEMLQTSQAHSAPLREEGPYVQRETQTSRSKAAKPKARWKLW